MQLLNEAIGAELGEVVAERGQAVALGGGAQGGDHMRTDLTGAEGAGCRDLGEAHQGMHQGQLPGIVELETGNAFAGRGEGGFGAFLELPAIDKRLKDILLDVEVIVIDRRELLAQRRQVPDGLVHPVVGDVAGSRLGPQDQVVAHVLLDEAVALVAADDGVGQVHVFDLGLQLAAVLLGDFAPENDGDLVWLADRAVGVEQTLAELIKGAPPVKDQVVAEFDLREEPPVLTARLPTLPVAEERGEIGQPFPATAGQVFGTQGVGQGLQTLGCAAAQKGVRALLEVGAFLARAVGQPVMLIETDPGRERQIGAHANEHPTPVLVVDIEVVCTTQRSAICWCQRLTFRSPIAVMMRAGSRALRMTTTSSGSAPRK
jgi:hypothetical protein